MPVSTVFITGANRGIGLGLVTEILKLPGIKLIFAGCRNPAEAKELEALRAANPNIVRLIKVEVTSEESLKEAVKQVAEGLGPDTRLDLLINNAGYYGRENVDPYTPKMAACLKNFEVNSVGPMLTNAAFLPLLKRAGGADCVGKSPAKVVNISSFLGSIEQCKGTSWFPDRSLAYAMSKAALNFYTRALAGDEPTLIVVSICPGWVKTEMGGPNAQITVGESTQWIASRAAGLMPNDTGLFFNREGPLPF